MICVTKITLVECSEEVMMQLRDPNPTPALGKVVGSKPTEYDSVKIEYIKGRWYENARGEEVCIGISKEAQKILGLPFDQFMEMEKSISGYENTVNRLIEVLGNSERELAEIKAAKGFQRLKYLFFGFPERKVREK